MFNNEIVLSGRLKRLGNIGCWCLALVMLLFLGVQYLTPWKWALVLGESVRGTIALMDGQTYPSREYNQGDYIVFVWQEDDPNHQTRLKRGMRLIKRVGCTPGQHLRVTARDAYCDEQHLGTVRSHNLQGQPLKPALYDGVVPAGRYFVLGDHPANYDSRYFGLVPAHWTVGRLIFKL